MFYHEGKSVQNLSWFIDRMNFNPFSMQREGRMEKGRKEDEGRGEREVFFYLLYLSLLSPAYFRRKTLINLS
jgi:hypothetical protein